MCVCVCVCVCRCLRVCLGHEGVVPARLFTLCIAAAGPAMAPWLVVKCRKAFPCSAAMAIATPQLLQQLGGKQACQAGRMIAAHALALSSCSMLSAARLGLGGPHGADMAVLGA